MSSDKPANAASSDATSKMPPPPKLTEADYLARQAQMAKEAISQTLHEMADSVKNMADPRAWIEQHPLASLGVGAAVGFVLASAVTPNREQTMSERLKSLFPEKQPEPPVAYIVKEEPRQQSRLLTPVLDAFKAAVAATVSSAIAGQSSSQGDNTSSATSAGASA